MRNSLIGTLLTQAQSGKTKSEKIVESQLKEAPSIKDLQIPERLGIKTGTGPTTYGIWMNT